MSKLLRSESLSRVTMISRLRFRWNHQKSLHWTSIILVVSLILKISRVRSGSWRRNYRDLYWSWLRKMLRWMLNQARLPNSKKTLRLKIPRSNRAKRLSRRLPLTFETRSQILRRTNQTSKVNSSLLSSKSMTRQLRYPGSLIRWIDWRWISKSKSSLLNNISKILIDNWKQFRL